MSECVETIRRSKSLTSSERSQGRFPQPAQFSQKKKFFFTISTVKSGRWADT